MKGIRQWNPEDSVLDVKVERMEGYEKNKE